MRTDVEQRIAHLYRRAGFGLSRSELDVAVAKGVDACIEELLHPENVDDPVAEQVARLEGEMFDLTKLDDAQAWWIYRLIHTRRPLQEKMTLFWHGHFATSSVKVERIGAMIRQNELFRKHALGVFEDLLLAVARDPAMLIWLDGAQSTKKRPNENFGRELLELFTLGIGNYTEDDVKAAARAFTGWKLKGGDEVRLEPKDHDGGAKTFLGQAWKWTGDDVIEVVVRHEATARRLAGKLVRFFVSDDGVPEFEAEVAKTYLESGSDMRATVGAILKSPLFFSDAVRRAKVKSPVEFVVGAIRELNAEMPLRLLPGAISRMGQSLFQPPSVKGWDGGIEWINTVTLFQRAEFANVLATQRGIKGDGRFDPLEWVKAGADAAAAREPFLDALFDGVLAAETRAALDDYLQSKDKDGKLVPFKATPASIDEKVRGLVRLLLASPEYQLA